MVQVKWPDGKKHEDIFVETLLKFGYGGKYLSEEWREKPLFIQSFAPTSLFHASKLTDSPLILLLDNTTALTQDTKQVRLLLSFFVMFLWRCASSDISCFVQTYAEITSDAYLKFISEYIVGLGPWKDTVVPPDVNNYLAKPTDLVARAHALGLQVLSIDSK